MKDNKISELEEKATKLNKDFVELMTQINTVINDIGDTNKNLIPQILMKNPMFDATICC